MDDLTPLPSSEVARSNGEIQSSQSSSVNIRIWRPAAQRNLRNQWSKLASLCHDWVSAASTARSHATSLVNSFLSQKYMYTLELGTLSEMPDIRKKACLKLSKQQRLLVMEFLLLGIHHQSSESNRLSWIDELFPGELEDLNTCNSYSVEACSPGLPDHPKYKVETSLVQPMQQMTIMFCRCF